MASPESLALAQGWLLKAGSDLATARILLHGSEKHLDTGSYHCQQAAEKALKAFLTASEIPFPKTHSLEELVSLCCGREKEFARFTAHAEELTPLAHEFRYPGEIEEPSLERADHALALAEEIYNFCKQKLGR